MNYVESELVRKQYLLELKRTFSNPFQLFDERVCGFVIGPFFSVAYHSPYEWNRRITGEVNRAWGFVKESEGKTEVYFIRGKGLLSPCWLLFLFVACYIIFWIGLSEDFDVINEPGFFWVSFAISVFICLITAFQSWVTEQGEAGANEITKLLKSPKDYYC